LLKVICIGSYFLKIWNTQALSIIPAFWEVEVRRIVVLDQPGEKVSERVFQQIAKQWYILVNSRSVGGCSQEDCGSRIAQAKNKQRKKPKNKN
jgi:hypothetical protein